MSKISPRSNKYLLTVALFPVVVAVVAPMIMSFYQLVFAVDTIQTAFYQDTNGDGMVDRIQWSLDETVTSCAYEAGDWSVDGAGDINVVAVTGISCTGADSILDISVIADPNITGGFVDPVLSYSNQGNLDDIVLASGPMTDKLGVAASDNAAPALLSAATNPQYLDSDADGIVNLTYIFFTEPVDYIYDDSDWTTTANDLTGYDVFECNSCIGVSPLELLATADPGLTGVSGGAEPTIEYSFLVSPIFDAVGNALTAFGPITLVDNAAPTLFSAVYLDTDADASIDTIRTTWTENVTMSGSTADDWSIDLGAITAVFLSAPDDATDGLTLDVLISADTNETGSTPIDIRYDNNDANNSVVDSPAAAGTTIGVTVSDGAAPIPVSAAYLDTDSDGTVDRFDVTWSAEITPVLNFFDNGDHVFSAGSSLGAITPTAAVFNGNVLEIDVTVANANVTASVVDPTYTYTDQNTLGSLHDGVGNNAVTSAAVNASDAASPLVTSWALDLVSNLLTLNFNESVDASTLAATGITVQNAATATQSVTLTGGTTASVDGTTIVVDMLDADVTSILGVSGLATSVDDTYLTLTTAVIDDLAGNNVAAIVDGSALQAGQVDVPSGGRRRSSTVETVSDEVAVETGSESVSSHSAALEDASGDSSEENDESEDSDAAPVSERFADIAGDPEEDAIRRLIEMGVLQGNPDGNFDPNGSLKRAAALKMVGLLIGLAADSEMEGDTWYSAMERALKKAGIIDGTIDPDTFELRANFLALVVKAKGKDLESLSSCKKFKKGKKNKKYKMRYFKDVSVKKWYCPVVQYAVDQGWIPKTPQLFGPSDAAIRSWAVGVLDRAFPVESQE